MSNIVSLFHFNIEPWFASNSGSRATCFGVVFEVTQISGALARTIIPWVGEGSEMRRGQRYGMIRLGSRVDIRVPAAKFTVEVVSAEDGDPAYPKGQFVQAGSTILFKSI